ncbi:MAG TPA: glutamine amidotransferase [Verrucomicrobiae bacterium]|nr:glutamine amidotransferase [Verrucomicrobiae bacterium]
MIQFTHIPRLPWVALGALLLLVFLWASYRRAKGKPSPGLRMLLITLRTLAITAVVLCLLDPQWVEIVKHQQKTRMAVLLDTSRSMSIGDVPGGRLGAAKSWLAKKVLPIVPAGVTLSTYTFGQTLAPLPSVDAAKADGPATALSDSLEQLLSAPSEDPLTGVILVSDGIDNQSPAPERAGKLFRRKGIPIHTVAVGTTNEMKDVILENVQVKRAVPNESPTRLGLTIRSPGFGGKKVGIQVRGQKEVVAAREVVLNGGTQTVELEVTPRQKGFQIYEASIGVQQGEWLATNNKRLFGLEVVDPTIHVLYMEGTPQQPGSPIPEWKYLKDALESDPNIKVKTLYRPLGNNGQFLHTVDADPDSGERIYPVTHPTKGFPRTLEGLLDYDVVIHSDIRRDSFTAEQLENMERLVEEFGGGFVMIGGNSAFGKGGYHRTILDRIIPVAMERENDSQAEPVRIRVPRAALSHPIMNIGSTPEETQMIWGQKFPYFYGYNRVDHAKPGATVLGLNPGYRNEFGPGLLLAVQEIGKGRSMAFMSDTTRSWGRDFETLWGEPVRAGAPLTEDTCDSRYYRKFWVNAIRWLASGKMGQTNNAVTLELARSYCSPTDAVAAQVKVRDVTQAEISNAEVLLFLSSGGKTNPPVRARYDSTSRTYVADIRPPGTGTFLVTATARRGGFKLGDDRQLLSCETTDVEMTDLRARPDFMANLAKDSGGSAFVVPDQDGASPAYVFANAPPPTIEYRRKPFWDKAGWMTLILALLGAEWAVRRAWGLA